MSENIFFLSDTHFKYHSITDNERKKRRYFLSFLRSIKGSESLYLVGDIFDFWFEYKSAVPKYFGDILAGLYELRGSGTNIFMTGGNHDYWIGSYLTDTIGINPLPLLTTLDIQGLRVTVTHGDMLLPGDYTYKMLKAVIRSRPAIALARLVHPDLLFGFAKHFSRASKGITHKKTAASARTLITMAPGSFYRWKNDVFITGHIHYPHIERFGEKTFVILGDWENHYSYARLSGGTVTLEYYEPFENTEMDIR